MTLETLQQWICDLIAADAWLAGRRVAAVAESRADAAAEIEAATAAFGLCALVMTPAFAADGQEEGIVSGTATVVVQVAEIPATNRAAAGHATALAAAQHIAAAATRWPGCSVAGVRLVDLGGDLDGSAVAYQTEIRIPLALSIDTTDTTD